MMLISWLLLGYILLGILSITRSNEPNYYKVLEVSPKASVEEIKKSYRSLAKKYHPDKNRDDPSAEQKFISITKAYEILSDPQQRAVYDDSLRHGGGRGNPFGNQDGNTMRNWRSNRPRNTNMEDIYRGFENSFDGFDDGSTTYMFRGPDGRVYYTRSSGFRFQYSSPPRQDNADIIQYILYGLLWPFLQVILLLLFCTSICQRCCGSTTPSRRANTADHYAQNPSQDNRYNSQNKQSNTSMNSTAHSYRPTVSTSSSLVPVVSELAVLQRGTIVVVAINPIGLTILNSCKAQFKHDPVSFFTMVEFSTVATNSYGSIEMLTNEIKKSPIQPLLHSLPFSELQSCDIIAFSKQGKKYAMCIRDNNEVFPDWLEQLLEGQITWMVV